MKTWQKAAIGIIGAGAAGYFIYNKFKNKSEAIDPGIEPEALVNSIPESTQSVTYQKTVVPFKEKVANLQKIIGVKADGVAGQITMAKLNQIISLSTLSTTNIDAVTKKVDVIVRAVNALAYNRNNTPAEKKARWNYWIAQVKKVDNMTFDPWVTKAYLTLTKRSVYADYSNRLQGIGNIEQSNVSINNLL